MAEPVQKERGLRREGGRSLLSYVKGASATILRL